MTSLFDQGPQAPCPRPFNLAAHVLGRADACAEKVALAVLGDQSTDSWSYARLKSAVLGTGTGLLRTGLKPGDRVLMRLDNTVEFPIAYLGAIAVGLVPVPTSAQLTSPEVARMITTLTPAAILRAHGVACPDTHVTVIDQPTLEAMRDLPAAPYDMGAPDRLAYIIYTSGTSGVPRAVCHAHRAIWARQMMFEGWYGLRDTDRLCHAGAFNWTYTLGTGLMDPWTIGATALIPAPEIRPEQLPGLLAQHKATIFAAAPGVYRKLLKPDQRFDLPDLRHGLSAGEKLSHTIRTHWTKATGTEIYEAYGMSECSTFISSSPSHPVTDDSLGRPQNGRRVAILGADGPVPLGHEGTIAVHRDDPGLMLGYLNAPEATAEKFRGDWFVTGDQGAMDSEGQITYLGRADDMMNAGGFRVSPLEVEAALNQHPGVTQCAVTDIEVKQDARLIMAFYTGPEPLPPETLDQFAMAELAAYKRPRGYFHVPALPTGANGKLLRRALRPIYEAMNGQA
ncbi:Acyl-CoA synthetase (AMP-forming)/AMP-acid ligase II [Roseovarius marisflavi]|uniref:Acyl-CoA synthetase (AMP-forming)/AMP-acid ligase II n=1 Tax=Roseovarius marisflavi TaxID=1054996 RepID=A0A1M6VPE4_9RHOB|nr:class I adenylate-forming enzyme family protein [Roseovarius marisflavi]SHK83363.1 Acyl-CoA synthetase (AMP-forming)/AMP-acid ligase II [Roseovarius marisflavi]